MTSRPRDRAIVLGAGMGGLLAARVLADHYHDVVVVERDTVLGVSSPRRGVPQARHAHGLIASGQQILEEYFPGLRDELATLGVPLGDFGQDCRWYFGGRRMAPAPTGLISIAAPRALLEHHVRMRVAALPSVSFLERHDVEGLVATADGGRVHGARVRERGNDTGSVVLDADLVVDTTGRGSRIGHWLETLGHPRPEEDRVKIDLAYTTRHYRLRSDPFDGDLAIIPVATPESPRGGLFFPTPVNGVAALSLTGLLGDHPPTDPAGFTAFASSLPVPAIGAALRDADPVDDPVRFTYPVSVWRHFERLPTFPRGLLVLGDAVCTFNPVYGQGMSVAAMESAALRDALHRGTEQERPHEYFRTVARLITPAWQTSAGADLGYPGVVGRRTPAIRLANAYISRLQRAAVSDPTLAAAFVRVAGAVDPPRSLMRPSLAWRVARASLVSAVRPQQRTAPAGPERTHRTHPDEPLRRAA